MSRHRDIRNLDYNEEYDEAYDDSVYGHSYDEHEYGTSPTTASHYMINDSNKDSSFQFGAFFPSTDKIVEEDDVDEEESAKEYHRRDSSNFERPRLSSEDEIRLNSILDEIRNVVGEHCSDARIIATVLEHKYDYEASLNAILNNKTSSSLLGPSQSSSFATALEQPKSSKRPRQLDRYQAISADGAGPSNIPNPVISSTSTGSASGFKSLENGVANIHTNEKLKINEVISEDEIINQPRAQIQNVTTISPKISVKIRDKKVDVEELYKEMRGSLKELLNLVVVGHVDAGKSTLMGHLLYLQGDVSQRTMHKYEQESKKIGKQSFMYAWVLDDTEEERSRGVTVNVAQRLIETPTKTIGLLDAPGHRDFIPNMITGAARADVSLLVVDASRGGFEAGFESGGQTREHAILVRSLGVSQIAVAVNKLDTVDWNQNRFEDMREQLKSFLKTVGFLDSDVTYVPCSGLTGENLIAPPPKESPLSIWYEGPTLLQAIDQLKVPGRVITKPVRMCIGDVYKGQGSNMIVAGKLETGYAQNGDRLLLVPQNEVIGVKGIQTDNGEPGYAFAGDNVTISVTGVEKTVLHVGDFLCDPANCIPQATRIEARIVVFNITLPIIIGSAFNFHYKSVNEMCRLTKLISFLHKSTGQVTKHKPRALLKNTTAVVELTFARSLCLEVYQDYKELGRFMLRNNGTSVAAGMVTKTLKCTDAL